MYAAYTYHSNTGEAWVSFADTQLKANRELVNMLKLTNKILTQFPQEDNPFHNITHSGVVRVSDSGEAYRVIRRLTGDRGLRFIF